MEFNAKYEKSEDIVSRKIGDETILVPINREVGELENVYALNKTAAFIWDQIDGRKSLEDIKEVVVTEYEVDSARAEQDLSHCVAQLEELRGIKKIK